MDSPRVAIWLVGTDDPGQAAVTALLVAVGAVMVMLMAYWLEAPLWLAALSLGGWFLLLRLGVQLGDRSLRRVGKLERQTLEETLETERSLQFEVSKARRRLQEVLNRKVPSSEAFEEQLRDLAALVAELLRATEDMKAEQ